MFNDYTINELNTLQFAITIMLRHISSCLQSLISLCLQIGKKQGSDPNLPERHRTGPLNHLFSNNKFY